MKKVICGFICLILLFTIVGCSSITEMETGFYYAVDNDEGAYMYIDAKDNSFRFARGVSYSHALGGNYEIKRDSIIATAGENTTLTFDIEDEKTIVLKEVDNADSFEYLIGNKFKINYHNHKIII